MLRVRLKSMMKKTLTTKVDKELENNDELAEIQNKEEQMKKIYILPHRDRQTRS